MAEEASQALDRLEQIDLAFATMLRRQDWVERGRNYPALISLAGVTRDWKHPAPFNRVRHHPAILDGISERESMVLATAHVTALDILGADNQITFPATVGKLLDPGQTDIEIRTIALPLAGEVELAIIRPHPFDACRQDLTMDIVEQSVRSIEEFMGVPFPMRPVVFLLTDRPGGGTRHETFISLHFGDRRECVSSHETNLTQLIAHETGHHYWHNDPIWIAEGAGAEFLGFLVDDKLQLSVDELEAHWVKVQGKTCTLVDTIAELEALPHQTSWQWDYADCAYSLGRQLMHELYLNMDGVVFRQGFRDLYLAMHGAIPNNDVTCRKAVAANHYGCLVEDAFKTYVPEDEWPSIEEIFTRRYGPLP